MKNSKFVFDKLSKIFEQGLITSKDLGSEILSILKSKRDEIVFRMKLTSKEEFEVLSKRVENIEETQKEIKTQIEDLSINSHPPIEFTKKLNELHDKIDSIYTLLETLSNRLNELEYQGEVTFGEAYHVGRAKKHVTVSLRRKDKEK